MNDPPACMPKSLWFESPEGTGKNGCTYQMTLYCTSFNCHFKNSASSLLVIRDVSAGSYLLGDLLAIVRYTTDLLKSDLNKL
jgi:hypothetical protein